MFFNSSFTRIEGTHSNRLESGLRHNRWPTHRDSRRPIGTRLLSFKTDYMNGTKFTKEIKKLQISGNFRVFFKAGVRTQRTKRFNFDSSNRIRHKYISPLLTAGQPTMRVP